MAPSTVSVTAKHPTTNPKKQKVDDRVRNSVIAVRLVRPYHGVLSSRRQAIVQTIRHQHVQHGNDRKPLELRFRFQDFRVLCDKEIEG